MLSHKVVAYLESLHDSMCAVQITLYEMTSVHVKVVQDQRQLPSEKIQKHDVRECRKFLLFVQFSFFLLIPIDYLF